MSIIRAGVSTGVHASGSILPMHSLSPLSPPYRSLHFLHSLLRVRDCDFWPPQLRDCIPCRFADSTLLVGCIPQRCDGRSTRRTEQLRMYIHGSEPRTQPANTRLSQIDEQSQPQSSGWAALEEYLVRHDKGIVDGFNDDINTLLTFVSPNLCLRQCAATGYTNRPACSLPC